MEKWLEKRSIHTMNLRSVFTAEQQRILERYYENGMTNQSKSCFQLILQCAQETKLDFSVVRTWVGNKRRKLASKADHNGVAAQGLSNHHALPAAAGALGTGSVLTAEMAAVRSVQRGPSVTHLLPPQVSCSSSSSSPSSSSPLSSGSGPQGNNHDVILTGIYSMTQKANHFDASAHNRMKSLPLHTEIELPSHTDTAEHHTTIAAMQRKAPVIPTSSTLKCSQIPFAPGESVGITANWAKQYRTSQPQMWPHTSPQKNTAVHRSPPKTTADNSSHIQHVFSLAALGHVSTRPLTQTSHGRERSKKPVDASQIFSIAMETGDADNEYSREEELANMGAQVQFSKGGNISSADSGQSSSAGSSSLIDSVGLTERSQSAAAVYASNSAPFGDKGCQTNSSLLIGTSSQGSIPLRLLAQTSSRMPSFKVTSNMSVPWLQSNSRKRTMQDRTQFSGRDVFTMKRYWDNGMTSLGSVCREKIAAAANELGVDTEIIKTWIGNRRRKYRLMGIEIPPPKGGPAVFSSQIGGHSPHTLEEDRHTPENGSEHDVVSLCLSDDGGSDFFQKDNDVNEESDSSTPAKNVIEIMDDDEDDDEEDMLTTEMEQIQNLLEFKNEEVQFLENELQNQKQKFSKLKSFTKSLLIAVKNNDRYRQQELLASLPQKGHEDWGLENHTETTSIQKESSVSERDADIEPMRL
ncbi:highly divergent homeobox-like isoform X2 [Myxocyprinus asiaticus]|uniref:highly divergent homeobox-like isoform X2 n=1 Tax=Myxocyprinus asiaticus TaxID=70543 RepID=UPI002221EE05|nr:highly divergent homeobox-like isoform X2 [Myxocyprinus asiaticus]